MPLDTATVALVVGGIAGLSAILQGVTQGIATSRAASLVARQETARAEIVLCDRLGEQVAGASQAANAYALELGADFLEDWSKRGPLVREVTRMHGEAFASLAALPADSAAREPVTRALEVVAALPSLGKIRDLNTAWSRDCHAIPDALQAIGRERAHQLRMLEVAPKLWWSRRRIANQRPRTPRPAGPARLSEVS